MTAKIQPSISAVMACRNEAKHLDDCIFSLWKQDYPTELIEVIVVDGLSSDASREIVHQWQTKWANVRILSNPSQITPVAFNLGVRAASGEVICILAPRNRLSPNYFRVGVERLMEPSRVVCVGGVFNNLGDTKSGEAIATAMRSSFGVGGGNFRAQTSDRLVDTVGVPLYRKSTIMEAGLFDEALVRNQDDDLNFRLRKMGGDILFCSSISVEYFVRGSFWNLFRQYQQYGYWKVFVGRKHRSATNIRQLVPPLALLLALILFIFSVISIWAGLLLMSLGALYLIMGVFAAFVQTKNLRMILNIVRSFMVLHFGYGIGYLKGVLDFIILGKRRPSPVFARITR